MRELGPRPTMNLLHRQTAALQAASWDSEKCQAHQRIKTNQPLEVDRDELGCQAYQGHHPRPYHDNPRDYLGNQMGSGEVHMMRQERCAVFESDISPTCPRRKAITAYARHQLSRDSSSACEDKNAMPLGPTKKLEDFVQQASLNRVVEHKDGRIEHPQLDNHVQWSHCPPLCEQRTATYLKGCITKGCPFENEKQFFEKAARKWANNSSNQERFQNAVAARTRQQRRERAGRAIKRNRPIESSGMPAITQKCMKILQRDRTLVGDKVVEQPSH